MTNEYDPFPGPIGGGPGVVWRGSKHSDPNRNLVIQVLSAVGPDHGQIIFPLFDDECR